MIPRSAFLVGVALLLGARAASAQSVPSAPIIAPLPDLTYTMPNGKVLTFGSPEQKQKFLAGLARMQTSASAPAPAPVSTPRTPAPGIKSSLDRTASRPGIGNMGAPIFTADYYLGGDPESWVGKTVTLAVASMTPDNYANRPDGYRQLTASTWNNAPGKAGDQTPGGHFVILARPEAARRLLTLCGSSMTTNAGQVRVTMIQGEFGHSSVAKGINSGEGRYCLYVER